MRRPLSMPVLVTALLAAGPFGCSRSPEAELRRARERVVYVMTHGAGGTITYEDDDPEKDIIGINLDNTQTLDAFLRPIGKLTTLRSLSLAIADRISDKGLRHLRNLTNLQTLVLRNAGITDAGLEHVAALMNLEVLDIGLNRVTDAGLARLHGLTRLRELSLAETQVTDAGVEELKKALPDLEVQR